MSKNIVMDTPLGANRPYQVTMNGSVTAGFDTYEEAKRYIRMQKEDNCGRGSSKKTFASQQVWDIKPLNPSNVI